MTERRSHAELEAGPGLAIAAGRRVRDALDGRPLPQVVVAVKLASEVAERLRIGLGDPGARVVLEIAQQDRTITIRFATGAPPTSAEPDDDLVTLLLDRLAARWGYGTHPGSIWFELGPSPSDRAA